jgi:hypothetical protein
MNDLVARLRSPAAAFYEYAVDGGALLREAADHIAALGAEVGRLTELVDDLTIQSTYGEHDANTFDSRAITAYAEGLRDMARRGRVRITHERYRRVIAEFTEEELARQCAVVDAARATPEDD